MFDTNLYLGARLALRRELRDQGYGFFQIRHLVAAAEEELINQAVAQSGVRPPVGGPVLDAIIEFFKSEDGKAIISVLIKILLAALV